MDNPKQPEVTEADYKAAHRIAELLEIEGWATGGGYFADHLVQEVAAIRIAARKQALEEAAKAYEAEADTWNELGPRKSAAKRQGAKAIRALAGKQP